MADNGSRKRRRTGSGKGAAAAQDDKATEEEVDWMALFNDRTKEHRDLRQAAQGVLSEIKDAVSRAQETYSRQSSATARTLSTVANELQDVSNLVQQEQDAQKSKMQKLQEEHVKDMEYVRDLRNYSFGLLEEEKAHLKAMKERAAKLVQKVDSGMVTLNVGGTLFTTTKDTLLAVEGSFFQGLLSGRFPPEADEDGNTFIDRDATLFEYVISWMRDPTSPSVLPKLPEEQRKAVVHELQYYGLLSAYVQATGDQAPVGGSDGPGEAFKSPKELDRRKSEKGKARAFKESAL